MEMLVSVKKCHIMASSPQIANQLEKELNGYRFHVCAAVKNIGHGFSQQYSKRKQQVLQQRIAKLRRRAHRFRALKHHGRGLARAHRRGGDCCSRAWSEGHGGVGLEYEESPRRARFRSVREGQRKVESCTVPLGGPARP
eukprot:233153-Pyramimonas_sp.AAC.1